MITLVKSNPIMWDSKGTEGGGEVCREGKPGLLQASRRSFPYELL